MKIIYKLKKLVAVCACVGTLGVSRIFAAAIPTFDYSNLITAIDSTMKAVEFYNSTLIQMQGYARQLEKLSSAVESGDFENIAKGIKDALGIISELSEEIESIKKMIAKSREDAEVKSKKATLEILDILTHPSIDGIRGYVMKYGEDMNAIELIKAIASDTKEALEVIFGDYSDSADEAIEQLENKYVTLARNLSKNFDDLKKSQSNYSYSMTAQQTLTAFLTELSAINRTLDNTKEGIETIKKDTAAGKKEINDTIESWKNILSKLDKAQGQNSVLKNDADEFSRIVEIMK